SCEYCSIAKLRKQSDIHEDGDDSVLSTQEYMKIVVEDVGEDEDFKGGSWISAVEFVNANGGGIVNGCLGDIENYLKNGKFEQVVAMINSCTPNAIGDFTMTLALILTNVSVCSPKPLMHYLNITKRNVVKVFHKDSVPGNGSGVGGSEMLMEEEEINVTHQEMVDEEALNLALDEEARQARADQEWLEKFEGGGALGANKASTHHVIDIFLYPLGVVEAACALEVNAIGALDLVKVEAVRSSTHLHHWIFEPLLKAFPP
ncbi:hypothetical protein Tco_0636108, partial [Tanacetum coccineum]